MKIVDELPQILKFILLPGISPSLLNLNLAELSPERGYHVGHMVEMYAQICSTGMESHPGGSGLVVSRNCPLRPGNYCFKYLKIISFLCGLGSLL